MVAVGVTLREDEPRTLPTPLSMLSELGAPPDRVHAKVADWPEVIEAGVAVNDPITGAATGAV